ncbi:hypothetical protein [Siccirubricoccus sp. G192]|uniref:CIS tube protein n=1 Tax=Siccirubricoccus sp. G192 TaxID=2849651 RepID=UPI001C2CBD05|nr:hypothetical protein [Siccirubricoccus sp. G192]MBV1800621.1 hypothetical protein [Siccirubricoccus sp. G192]MBV1800685.1 hypothetical protein [Siccirubricoccus sp. G192]
MNKLEKAVIEIMAGERRGTRIGVLFNPTEYTIERSNTYKATALLGLGSPLLQFVNGDADQLSMELFLEDFTDPPRAGPSGPPRSVSERITELSRLLLIDSSLHAPPPVKFAWGRLSFDAVIEKLSQKHTLFRPDGTPARATLSVSFKEYRSLGRQLREPRRESADKTKRRQLDASDSIWALAAREYGDAAFWRLIAEASDLDNPRELAAGTWLLLPPLEENGVAPTGTR